MNFKNTALVMLVLLIVAVGAALGFRGYNSKDDFEATTTIQQAANEAESTEAASTASEENETYIYVVPEETTSESEVYYTFRTDSQFDEHFEKHKADTQTSSKEEYLYRANYVITNVNSLHKTEAEDGDDIYYLESTNEIVFVSTDGYIRTYFCPDSGKAYFDKQ